MPFVLDASVALAWCFPDESNHYAASILNRFKEDYTLVPAVWSAEVANALAMGRRRQHISSQGVLRAIRLLQELTIKPELPSVQRTFTDVMKMATHNGRLSVCDAPHVELAQRKQCPLATLDGQLSSLTRLRGVEVIEPDDSSEPDRRVEAFFSSFGPSDRVRELTTMDPQSSKNFLASSRVVSTAGRIKSDSTKCSIGKCSPDRTKPAT